MSDKMSFNGTDYNFEIKIRNKSGEIELPKSMFKELSIEESFLHWEFRGYLIFDNAEEQLERFKKSKGAKNSEYFHFRRDGTDEIEIKFTPVWAGGSQPSFLDKIKMEIKGAIYDEEDLVKNNISDKLKKLYFWNVEYQKAVSLNTRVSCGEYLKKKGEDIEKKSNEDRMVLNEDLLKYIVEDKLGAKVDTKKWDTGTHKTFYVSNPTMYIKDDIDYLMKTYTVDDKYPGFFSYNRIDNKFTLISYKKLFENYMKDDRELFEFVDNSTDMSSVVPARYDEGKSYHFSSTSDIRGYKYSKMSASANTNTILSRVSSTYENKTKKFTRKAEKGHIDKTKENYKAMFSTFPPKLKNPLFISNKDKKENKLVKETHILEPSDVCIDTIRDAVLYNDAIQIHALGLVGRVPGGFIDLSSQTDTEGIWEDIFLGSWLIVGVTHKITTTDYTNDILAIKPNMSPDFTYKEDGELHPGKS